jgi:hypothetical protein
MSRRTKDVSRRMVQAALAAMITAAPAALANDEPLPEATQQQIQALKERIGALQTAQIQDSAATAAVIANLLRDAEQRSQLMADGGAGAGYDGGFFIRSGDGAFSIKPQVLFQFRNISDYRNEVADDGDSSTQTGFEVRRLRFILAGNAFGPDLTYRLAWDTNQNTGSPFLLDAWANYKLTPDWGIRAGQFIDPFAHEQILFPGNQLAVDVSLANLLVGGGLTDRVQGVSLRYGMYAKDKPINAELAFHDGGNSKNTDFRDTVGSPDTRSDWGVSGRMEAKASGDWPNYLDFTAINNKSDLLVLGAAFDVTGTTNDNIWAGTADVQWEVGKLALYGALYMRYHDMREADEFTDWGGVAQAGYLLTNNLEIYGRYSMIQFDNSYINSEDTAHEFTVGGNYYFKPAQPHAAKITIDLNYLPNGSPTGTTGLGYQGGTDEAEWSLRCQFQLFI